MPTPEHAEPTLPRNFLRSCVLLLLLERPAHGYDLLERLRPLGFLRDDPGRLYRALRGLEAEGLVHSARERSQAGPDRRVYELTRMGREDLHREALALGGTAEVLAVFLSRYEEFVAIGRGSRRHESAPNRASAPA